MRMYIIILGDIQDLDNDVKFKEIVDENKFEYWRFVPLNWIIATPYSVDVQTVIGYVGQAYKGTPKFVFEVDVKDMAASIPPQFFMDTDTKDIDYQNSTESKSLRRSMFGWFTLLKSKGYVPKWDRGEGFNEKEHKKLVNEILDKYYK